MPTMVYLSAFLAFTGAAEASGQSNAQIEARQTPEYMRCLEADGGYSTPGMIGCANAETERQDVRLNQTYKLALGRLSSVKKAHLRSSERKWIERLHGRCVSEAASEEGGSLANVIYANCILDETIKRTIWIEKYRG